MALLTLFAACSSDAAGDEGTMCSDKTRYNGPTGTLNVYLSMPEATTRVADPGEANEEGSAWDRLAIVVAYTTTPNDGKTVRLVSLSYAEYLQLSDYNASQNIKILPLKLPEGTVHLYGFTYSDDAASGLNFTIGDGAINGVTTETGLKDLTISNDYSADIQKFCSVATGFYVADDAANKATPSDLAITAKQDESKIPVLKLTRLATKLDIQWDAQDAYTAGLTNVKVQTFTYNGGASSATGSGSGRLFPTLASQKTALGGAKTFVNTSEISKRNGRVVHYVFPDGSAGAKVTFSITSTSSSTNTTNTYTFNFPNALQQATWYKINATIVGNSGKSSVINTGF